MRRLAEEAQSLVRNESRQAVLRLDDAGGVGGSLRSRRSSVIRFLPERVVPTIVAELAELRQPSGIGGRFVTARRELLDARQQLLVAPDARIIGMEAPGIQSDVG